MLDPIMFGSIKSNDDHWTVIIESKVYNFDPTHPQYENLVECVMMRDCQKFLTLINLGEKVEHWSCGNFCFRDGVLYYGDEEVAKQPTERILSMIQNKYDYKPMLEYLKLLYENVSNRAITESYDWCSHKGLPITDDGYLLGYKGVIVYDGPEIKDKMGNTLKAGDLVDKHTGKSFRNLVGDKCKMKRSHVNDNCNEGCSSGLHVGTYEYANSWAGNEGVVVLVKFSPADIVSVPTDCNFQKMRVCEYTVVGVARGIIKEDIYTDNYDEDFEPQETSE